MTQKIDFQELKPYLPNYLQEEYDIDLHRGGACPICGNGHKTPCFHYNKKDNTAKCFSCGWHGDLINLVAETEQISLRDAGKLIAERYEGKTISAPTVNHIPTKKTAQNANFTEFVNQCAKNPRAHSYFIDRGLSEAVVNQFKLGFDDTINAAIIPYFDTEGAARWYTGRCIDESQGKYRNPQGYSRTFPFNVSELLADTDTPIFIVEGEINALSAIDAGFPACGLGSTTSSRLFIKFVKEHHSEIKRPLILMLDNDEPGKKAQREIQEKLSDAHISCISAAYPIEGEDINDTLKRDKNELHGVLSGFYRTAIERSEETIDTLVKEKNYSAVDALQSFLLKVQSPDFKPTPTGFAKLDEALGGGLYSGLCLIAAAPSEGKSALAMQIVETIAEQQGRDVLVFSFEMSQTQLISRSISRLTYEIGDRWSEQAMTALEVLQGNKWDTLSTAKTSRLNPAIERYEKNIAPHLWLIDDAEPTTGAIMNIIKQFEAAHPGQPPIILVDYLQLLGTGERSFVEECKDISLALKKYAIEQDTIVFAISSVNRQGQQFGNSMTTLYGSSFAEYGSDTLLMIDFTQIKQRVPDADKDELKRHPIREMTITIQKNRMGRTGVEVPFYYAAAYNHFTDTPVRRELEEVGRYAKTSKEKREMIK